MLIINMYNKKRYTAKKSKSIMYTKVNRKTRNAKRTGGYYIKDLMYGKEIKTLDRTNAGASPGVYNPIIYAGNIPTEICLNRLDQGVAANQRVGNKVRFTTLHLRATITLNPASANPLGDVRVIVLYDKQSNSTGPSFTNVYSSDFAVTNCMMDPSFFERYVTIIDKKYTMTLSSSTACISIEEFRKLNKDSMYTGSGTGNYGNIASGSLTLYFVSDDAFIGSPPITRFACNYFCRMRFVDV